MSNDSVKIRKRIHDYVDKADDRFLNLVNNMIDADEQDIIGYRPDGSPISKNNLKKTVEIAEQQIKEGNVISKQDFLEDFELWKKNRQTTTK